MFRHGVVLLPDEETLEADPETGECFFYPSLNASAGRPLQSRPFSLIFAAESERASLNAT